MHVYAVYGLKCVSVCAVSTTADTYKPAWRALKAKQLLGLPIKPVTDRYGVKRRSIVSRCADIKHRFAHLFPGCAMHDYVEGPLKHVLAYFCTFMLSGVRPPVSLAEFGRRATELQQAVQWKDKHPSLPLLGQDDIDNELKFLTGTYVIYCLICFTINGDCGVLLTAWFIQLTRPSCLLRTYQPCFLRPSQMTSS
jgi:hypothetical protein